MSEAREAALDQYVAAYDGFLARKVDLMREGEKVKAAGASQYALWIERAIEAEIRNPTGEPPCACSLCQRLIVAVRLREMGQ